MSKVKGNINVICLEEEAFYALLEEVVKRTQVNQKLEADRWISDVEAMKLLRIKSKTTLQRLRDEGKIRYSQPTKKHILYDRQSILEYLERHSKEKF